MYNVEVWALSSLRLEHGREFYVRCIVPVPTLSVALSIPTWTRVWSDKLCGLVAHRARF